MKLLELIEHLKTIESAEKLIEGLNLDMEFLAVEIYMIDKIDMLSELAFFDSEAVMLEMYMTLNNINYIDFLGLDVAQEIVEANDGEYSNHEIAERMIEYRLRDA